jgi:uncharacterized protein YceK
MKLAVAMLFVCSLLGGCASVRVNSELDSPAPSSSIDQAEAWSMGHSWSLSASGRACVFPKDTGSMVPTLDSHTMLLLERVTARDLRPHDIALYSKAADGTGDETICHRVLKVNSDGFVYFCGDSTYYVDGWVAPQRIRWRVAGTIFTH